MIYNKQNYSHLTEILEAILLSEKIIIGSFKNLIYKVCLQIIHI